MKNKNIVILVCVVCLSLCIGCMLLYFSSVQQNKILINPSQSYLSHFDIQDGHVYFYCTLTIENHTSFPQYISMAALFSNDVDNGLLKNPLCDGYSQFNDSKVFLLQEGENILNVVFVGLHNGGTQKHDRTLPEIQISLLP